MSRKKGLLIVAAGMAVCLTAVAVVLIALFLIPGMSVDHSLPVYTSQQTPSTHPGYRHTTLSSGNTVYVNDYDEYSLQLINRDPLQAIGRREYGGARVCVIPGQKPADYVAADVGSEMPAYAVFRNSQLPPFDWRTATFQKMQFTWSNGSGVNKFTTEPALIADVVRILREGVPATLSTPVSGNVSHLAGIGLFSDQLPGLTYCPAVYLDPTGSVYLAENMVMETTNSNPRIQARWIPASPQFAEWVHLP